MQSNNYKYNTKHLNKTYKIKGGSNSLDIDGYNDEYITLSYYGKIRYKILLSFSEDYNLSKIMKNGDFIDFVDDFDNFEIKKSLMYKIIKNLYKINNDDSKYTLKKIKYNSDQTSTNGEPYIDNKTYNDLELEFINALKDVFLFCDYNKIPYWNEETSKFQSFHIIRNTELEFLYKELYSSTEFNIGLQTYLYYKLKLKDIIETSEYNKLSQNDKSKYKPYEKEIITYMQTKEITSKNYILDIADTENKNSFYKRMIIPNDEKMSIPESIKSQFTEDSDTNLVYDVLCEARKQIIEKETICKNEFILLSNNQKVKVLLKQKEQNNLDENLFNLLPTWHKIQVKFTDQMNNEQSYKLLSIDEKLELRMYMGELTLYTPENNFILLTPTDEEINTYIMTNTKKGDLISWYYYNLLNLDNHTEFKYNNSYKKWVRMD